MKKKFLWILKNIKNILHEKLYDKKVFNLISKTEEMETKHLAENSLGGIIKIKNLKENLKDKNIEKKLKNEKKNQLVYKKEYEKKIKILSKKKIKIQKEIKDFDIRKNKLDIKIKRKEIESKLRNSIEESELKNLKKDVLNMKKNIYRNLNKQKKVLF